MKHGDRFAGRFNEFLPPRIVEAPAEAWLDDHEPNSLTAVNGIAAQPKYFKLDTAEQPADEAKRIQQAMAATQKRTQAARPRPNYGKWASDQIQKIEAQP